MTAPNVPWLAVALLALSILALLHRPLGRLFRLAARSAVGLAVLALFSQVGQFIGVSLGVNLVNALILGVLGVPGFGLLLMLQWVLR
jgi:inhibitor of the pro-sigma K processing machinery